MKGTGAGREKSGLTSIPFYVDRVLQEMGRDYGVKDVKGRGLQIYTAIDLNAQDAAAKVLEAGWSRSSAAAATCGRATLRSRAP